MHSRDHGGGMIRIDIREDAVAEVEDVAGAGRVVKGVVLPGGIPGRIPGRILRAFGVCQGSVRQATEEKRMMLVRLYQP